MAAYVRRSALVWMLLVGLALGDIRNWETGETIPGTELITAEPGIVLDDWNTETQNLRFADLAGLNLGGSRFTNSWLDNAKFDRTFLGQSNLSHASLTNASLNHVTQTGADFTSANLTNADLTGAFSDRANLSGADLTGANLTDAKFGSAKLTTADFSESLIAGASFQGAADFTSSQLYSTASYKQKTLPGVFLGLNDLSTWDFSGQDLSHASFFRASMAQANLSQSNLTDAQLSLATLGGADFTRTDITGAIFRDATGFSIEQLYSTTNYGTQNLSRINFGGTDLRTADLAGFDLTATGMEGTILRDADFSGADLTDAWLPSATLANANLTGAIITAADSGNTTSKGFTPAQFYSTLNYQNGDLQQINLNSNSLDGWDFLGKNLAQTDFWTSSLVGADLSGAVLTRANLGVVDLTGADLTDADLTHASLWTATLTNTNMTGANISKADFSRTTALGFTPEQLYSTANYQGRDLRQMRLGDNNLSGWNFRDQDLSGADFGASNDETILSGADFEQANLSGASFFGAKLIRANLSDAVVTRAFLSHVTMTSDQLYATANYKEGDLQGIRLDNNDLTGWDFAGINLIGSDFGYSDLSTADLTGANLSQSSLEGTQLIGASLAGANLTGSELHSANLNGANLSNANLKNAILVLADLTNANTTNTDLTGADLRSAVAFSPNASTITRNTIWPDGRMHGLSLQDDETFLFPSAPRDPDSFAASVDAGFTIGDDATLALQIGTMRLDDSGPVWSHISVSPNATVDLGGTLRILEFGGWLTSPAQLTSWDLFDWPQPLEAGNVFSNLELPAGAWDVSKLYSTGEIGLAASYQGDGDFDVDGEFTANDIDRLSLSLRGGRDESYDVTDDGRLDQQDHRAWVESVAGTVLGDANLDGTVEFVDFLMLANNFGDVGGWAEGDFNGDGHVQFVDFLTITRNFGMQGPGPSTVSVPEVSSMKLALMIVTVLAAAFRSRILGTVTPTGSESSTTSLI